MRADGVQRMVHVLQKFQEDGAIDDPYAAKLLFQEVSYGVNNDSMPGALTSSNS